MSATLPARSVKRFSDWLKTQGRPFHPPHAVTYENTDKLRHTPAPLSTEAASFPQAKLFMEYAKAVNAERYRVTAIKMGKMGANGEKKVMSLDKRNRESRGFTPEELAGRMPKIVKLARRVENIYSTPLSEQKRRILIDNMSPEKVLQFQEDGFRPAVLQESVVL